MEWNTVERAIKTLEENEKEWASSVGYINRNIPTTWRWARGDTRGGERERKPKHRTRTWLPVQKIIIVMFDRSSYSMDNNAYSERPCSDKLYKHKWLSSPQSVVRVDLHRQITGLWPAGWVIDLLRWGELYVGQADNFVPLCRAGAHGLDRSQALVFVSTLQVCLTIQ